EATEPTGQAQRTSLPLRFSFHSDEDRGEMFEVTKCYLKPHAWRATLLAACFHRTWRHHGCNRSELEARHRNEPLCGACIRADAPGIGGQSARRFKTLRT